MRRTVNTHTHTHKEEKAEKKRKEKRLAALRAVVKTKMTEDCVER
jgi:hypothetical protein